MVYFCLTLFLCSCSYCILSYLYKTLKMPAHWCIYKCIFYIYLIKYLYYISENKAMLIQLLAPSMSYIYIYIYMYIYIYICIYIYIYIYILVVGRYRR